METKNQFAAIYNDVYLVNGARTPFGKFCGTLGGISPTDLGIIAGKEALLRSGLAPNEIQHVVFANIIQSSVDAIYLPRHIAQYCGIPIDIFGTGGGEKTACSSKITFLGKIPLDANMVKCGDAGISYQEKYPDSLALQRNLY